MPRLQPMPTAVSRCHTQAKSLDESATPTAASAFARVPAGGALEGPRRASASRHSLKSDLARVDAHVVKPKEYEELPELTEEMLARAKINKGGRPLSPNPRKLISLRLPADVIERWKATGPGWQTRMAERLSKVR